MELLAFILVFILCPLALIASIGYLCCRVSKGLKGRLPPVYGSSPNNHGSSLVTEAGQRDRGITVTTVTGAGGRTQDTSGGPSALGIMREHAEIREQVLQELFPCEQTYQRAEIEVVESGEEDGNGLPECAICTFPINHGDSVIEGLVCHNHVYHRRCMMKWFNGEHQRDDCPVCRKPMWSTTDYSDAASAVYPTSC